ncbi:MAG: hypothetical protein M3T96_07610 [Acidobacteriota bacterium]|nr:hypothetical protein [Acidobacteriota bacterium]
MKNFISNLINFVVETEPQGSAGFVDESYGRMKSQEVLEIVIPIAENYHFIYKSDSYSFGFKEIGLFSDTKNDRLVWIVHFEWLETDGKSMESYLDTTIATIKVDDESGKILSVWQKGMSSEMSYSDFLKLLED